jgi:hypothetical protein
VIGFRDDTHMNIRAVTLHASPLRTHFLRLGREHLIFFDQQIIPVLVPRGANPDSTHFRGIEMKSPLYSEMLSTELAPEHWLLHPSGLGFHQQSTNVGGVRGRTRTASCCSRSTGSSMSWKSPGGRC